MGFPFRGFIINISKIQESESQLIDYIGKYIKKTIHTTTQLKIFLANA